MALVRSDISHSKIENKSESLNNIPIIGKFELYSELAPSTGIKKKFDRFKARWGNKILCPPHHHYIVAYNVYIHFLANGRR